MTPRPALANWIEQKDIPSCHGNIKSPQEKFRKKIQWIGHSVDHGG